MRKNLLLLLSIGALSALTARDLSATKSCEAFNNLRHTKNSGHVVVEAGKSYHIAREQKGNYFIKVDGAKPTMRWISRDCFSGDGVDSSLHKNDKSAVTPANAGILQQSSTTTNKMANRQNSNLDSVLVLSWFNTFCETHSNKKECRRDGGDAKNHLVLHGLWPQPRRNEYCGVNSKLRNLDRYKRWNALPSLNLNSEVKELMANYMPGSLSNLQRHEYYKHGSCYSKDANLYYKDALTMTQKVDSTIGEYLRANLGKKVDLYTLRKVASRLISKDVANKMALKCKGRVLNEIWIPLKGTGSDLSTLVKDAKRVRSNCKSAIVDKAGKFRR